MLEALEKIKPNLAALAGDVGTNSLSANGAQPEATICTSCGAELVAGEQYCGTCGSPRVSLEVGLNLQSKLGAFLKSSAEKETEAGSSYQPADPFSPASRHTPQPEAAKSPSTGAVSAAQSTPSTIPESSISTDGAEPRPPDGAAKPAAALTTTEDSAAWTSAAKAKDFLEQLSTARSESAFGRFWSARRGDVYLAVAVILVAIVVRWGIWSEHSVSATGIPAASGSAQHQQPDSTAELSLFDKMLISMGLADPPEAPQDKGNPYTQVWVDLHTALYYCPGADLYGKTPKGKYASQRDAQLDQFEPAYRKNCD